MLGKSHKKLVAQPRARARERIWTMEANVQLAHSLRGQGCVVSLQRELANKRQNFFFPFYIYSHHFHTVLQLVTN